jgi:hypothetical protein
MMYTCGRGRAAALILALVAVVALSALTFLSTERTGAPEQDLRASTLQVGAAPVAVIADLPDSVSNGTQKTLSAGESYDPDGYIVSWLWTLEYGDTVEHLDQETEVYQFVTPGLYKIRLTVTDNASNTGVDFTAVYSVVDADSDGMPDWWEVKHFDGISTSPTWDPDEDGYTNFEEYVHGTDPFEFDAAEGEGLLEQYWRELAIVASAIAVASVLVYRHQRRRRKEAEHKKVEYAIEIQRALDED